MATIWTKAQLISDVQSQYVGVGTPSSPDGGPVNGVTKYIVNVVEQGLSQNNKKPTSYRKNVTFYVVNDSFSTAASSVTSLTIGVGQQTLTIGTALQYVAAQPISLTNGSNVMYGTVVSYTSGTGVLVVNVTSVVGSGTFASWTVSPPETAGYELNEPMNQSNTDVTITSSSYANIAKLYQSAALQGRVLAAVITQSAYIFMESSTSTSSLTIATGAQSLTVGLNLGYNNGLQMTISNSTNTMIGTVTSYNSATGALVVNVATITGSGTFTSWTVVPTNHVNRMKLVNLSNQNLMLVVMEFMSAVALNATVQAAGTACTDATLQAIVTGAWDPFASLIVT